MLNILYNTEVPPLHITLWCSIDYAICTLQLTIDITTDILTDKSNHNLHIHLKVQCLVMKLPVP